MARWQSGVGTERNGSGNRDITSTYRDWAPMVAARFGNCWHLTWCGGKISRTIIDVRQLKEDHPFGARVDS